MCDLGTRDLQTLTKTLLASGALATPPTEDVARRARRIQQRRARAAAVAVLAVLLGVTVSVRWAVFEPDNRLRVVNRPASSTTAPAPGPSSNSPMPSSPTTTATTTTTVPVVHAPQPLACAAGRNGGATDVGVTEDAITVTMTETLRFPDRYTTLAAYDAVRQVFTTVNQLGGICGRLLRLDLVNPVWGTAPWEQHNAAVAGIAGPLDENADHAIAVGRVDRSRTPLVTTGVTPVHFQSSWVWPVLPPAQTITRIAVDHAYNQLGARTFALVYEDDVMHRQAAPAFEEYVATLAGATVVHTQPLDPDDGTYEDEAAEVATACGLARCDFVFLALSKRAVGDWWDTSLVRGRVATAGFPSFARSRYVGDCVPLELRLDCKQVHVWTAPGMVAMPADPYRLVPEEASVGDVTLVDSARVGAERLVEALRRVGPDVTRERLRQALDDVTMEVALVRRQPDGRRVFDIPVRAWRPTVNKEAPVPFSELRPFTGWLRDPYTDWMRAGSTAG